jgi:hypothetical protein
MLKDSKGHKLPDIEISEDQCRQMMEFIRDGILRKINAVRSMQTIEKDIAAGLYVYAVEEFGKLLLLRDAPPHNGKRKVKYDLLIMKRKLERLLTTSEAIIFMYV